VFTITPVKPDRGTLFDYGADFYEIGMRTGDLAARVLHGADPTQMPIVNLVAASVVVDTVALLVLSAPWRVPGVVLPRANIIADRTGVHQQKPAAEINSATK